jgi:hypothetical protein
MKIDAIKTYNQIFFSAKKPEQNTFVTKPDSFEKRPFDFNNETKVFYKKLQKSMNVVTPQDIVAQAKRVSQKTGVSIEDVYDTMGILSQYSSYKSLSYIEKELKKHDIKYIDNLGIRYMEQPYGNAVCLTNILHYLSLKNFQFKRYFEYSPEDKKAIIVDSNLTNLIKNDRKFYIGKKNCKLFYIENFEKGYNFLNQNKSFEDFTVDTIRKAKSMQKYTGKDDLSSNVSFLLNSDVMGDINMLTYLSNICVIKRKNISTPEKIADNLNPIMPDYNTFKSVLDEISQKHKVSTEDGEKYVMKALNKEFEVITPTDLSKHLQIMHKKIINHLIENNRDFSKVYYVIPSNDKSFSLVNYQYQKANNIKEMPNYTMIRNSDSYNGLDVNELPEGSTFIILDDYLISGHSMMREQFPYHNLVSTNKSFSKKNMQIIFAPVFATKNGIKNFQEFIDKANRTGKDCIITSKILPKLNFDGKQMKLDRSNEFLTSSIMPYMGPDSNALEFLKLYEKFLYKSEAQKTPLSYFDYLEELD